MALTHLTPWANVATVIKPQGLKGEVSVVPADGLPFLLREGMKACLTPPALRMRRWFKVEAISPVKRGWRVKFEGIDDISDAEKFTGALVLIAREDVGDISQFRETSILGRSVEDEERGAIGCISEELENAAYKIWAVAGPYGEVLVPVVDDIVLEIPEDEDGPVRVRLPKGLLDLTASANANRERAERGVGPR